MKSVQAANPTVRLTRHSTLDVNQKALKQLTRQICNSISMYSSIVISVNTGQDVFVWPSQESFFLGFVIAGWLLTCR